MLHTLLNLTRPLIVFDLETTGTNTQQDRIVEVGFQVWNHAGMAKEWRSLVNPGIPIPEAATKVHHITNEAVTIGCAKCGRIELEHPGDECPEYKPVPTFAQLAPHLVKGFANCDYAGKNVRFDIRMLAKEMRRVNVAWTYVGARIIDAERIEQIAVPRSLGHLHEKYVGHKHDGAHGALSDVRASATVIAKQLEVHQTLPRDLDTLHKAQWPGMIDLEGKFRFVDGVPCFSRWGKFAEQPMTAVKPPKPGETNYWDFILKSDFADDVKAIAAAAKLGNYPKEP